MLGTPQHRVSERGSSVRGGARPSHTVLTHLAELEELVAFPIFSVASRAEPKIA